MYVVAEPSIVESPTVAEGSAPVAEEEPLEAAVMSPLPLTVMFALVKLPTLELTVAKVRA